MLVFKKIDFWISATSIFVFFILSIIRQDGAFFIGYFSVGAWQVISMVVHQANSWFVNKGSNRYYYHYTTLAVVVCMLLAPLVPFMFFVFYLLIFMAPVMAVYYTSICFRELRVLEAQKLIHLK